MNKTSIVWTDFTLNPVTGCTPVSEGCKNCYAAAIAKRFNGGDFSVKLHPERLSELAKRKKPSKIFVCSMSDLFHPDVPFGFIDSVIIRIMLAKQHTCQILTKRPQRAAEFFRQWYVPLIKNLWFGVTIENQKCANDRTPLLLEIQAAVRFVSLEPCLESVSIERWLHHDGCPYVCDDESDYEYLSDAGECCCDTKDDYRYPRVNWVIVGAESGPGRRECKIEWVRSIVKQCKAADVPVFVKQLSIDGKISHDMKEFPEDLQIRQFPKGGE